MLIRDLKIRQRRRQRELHKSNRFNNQNNNFAGASRFFVHFFAVTARLRRENAYFHDSFQTLSRLFGPATKVSDFSWSWILKDLI